jgi:hypothetical protein
MPNVVKFRPKKYLTQLIASMTSNRLLYEMNDLLVFLDETGKPKLNSQHSAFAIGGCAMLGYEYATVIRDTWVNLKADIFGLTARQNFHACEHLIIASDEQLIDIAQFISATPMKLVMAVVDLRTHCDPGTDSVHSVLLTIQNQVSCLIGVPVRADRWVVSHSTDIARHIVTNMFERAYNYFLYPGRSDFSGGLTFMPQQAAEPGLEIADLLVYLAGLWHRRAPNWRPGYTRILAAAFDDSTTGLSTTILLQASPIVLMNEPGGIMKVNSRPSLKLWIERSPNRQERRRKKHGAR